MSKYSELQSPRNSIIGPTEPTIINRIPLTHSLKPHQLHHSRPRIQIPQIQAYNWPDGVVGYHVSLTVFKNRSDKVLGSNPSLVNLPFCKIYLLLKFSPLRIESLAKCQLTGAVARWLGRMAFLLGVLDFEHVTKGRSPSLEVDYWSPFK
jgi:hypothetical protein